MDLAAEKKRAFWKAVALWSLGGMLLIVALWVLVTLSSGTTSQPTATLTMPKVTKDDFQTGSASAKVTLTEYSDFQCPACKAYYPLVKQLQKDFGDKLHFVYRFFPLKSIHQNAVNSAKAGYAASLQGKFWEMHDVLFENQDEWATLADPEQTFVGYAKKLGLNADQFKTDYEAGTTLVFVNNAYDKDTAIGLNATPTFFLNGKQMANPQSYADFKKAIEDAMK